jgi:uncharacterized peroxidase-related enzyme
VSSEPTPDEAGLDAFVHQAADDWRAAPLNRAVRALLEYAEKVTLRPAACTAADVEALRAAGWCDLSIHDAAQAVALFNYINRVADALGVDPEEGLPVWGRRAVS